MELLYGLRRGGMDVPLTGLTAEDCADTICRAFFRGGREVALEAILQVENLTHTYSAGTPFQRSAVEGMSLHVGTGEFFRHHRTYRQR